MRIVLADLPWAPVDVPSLALGILTSATESRFPADEVEVLHANVDFCEWVSEQRSFTFDDYGYHSVGSSFDGCGDWVFSSALHGVPSWRADEFDASMEGRWTQHQRDLSHALHALAPRFVDRLAHRIVATAPDLVGFASTFRQYTASLAAARRVKELNPAIRTVLGGADIGGVQGAAMHRNFPAVDFVVRGSGEVAFADLLTALADGGDLAPIPGLCWRDRSGTAHANPTSQATVSSSAIVRPAFRDHGLRFHYETRPNVRRHRLAELARAGIVQVRPGIESLNKRVLSLMDNGVSGCTNVRLLRDARSERIRPIWSYCYGFPGEHDTDYLPVLEQFPALHHLAPPTSACRIMFERSSPFLDHREPGFAELRPAGHYRIVHDLPERELFDLAHLFSAPEQGIGEETIARLESAVDVWRSAHRDCRLVHWNMDDVVRFFNSRPHFAWREFTIADPLGRALLRLLDDPRGLSSLVKRLTAELGANVTHDEVRRILDRWTSLGLVFHDGGQYIHVATAASTGNRSLH
ncbi:cobalamin-dependent protein [Spirillospora sp. NPDC052269]